MHWPKIGQPWKATIPSLLPRKGSAYGISCLAQSHACSTRASPRHRHRLVSPRQHGLCLGRPTRAPRHVPCDPITSARSPLTSCCNLWIAPAAEEAHNRTDELASTSLHHVRQVLSVAVLHQHSSSSHPPFAGFANRKVSSPRRLLIASRLSCVA